MQRYVFFDGLLKNDEYGKDERMNILKGKIFLKTLERKLASFIEYGAKAKKKKYINQRKKNIIYIIRLNSFRQNMKNKSRLLNIFKFKL